MTKKENPVDYVLDRMVEAVLGENAHFKSHAEALGIPENTIKTWRRRGEVPPAYLANFARDWKSSVDYLMRGRQTGDVDTKPTAPPSVGQKVGSYGALADDERKLLENYRKLPPEVRETLQLVASIASRPQGAPAKPSRVKVRTSELPPRKFTPPPIVGGEQEASPARARKKRGNA